jgi:hypothetical protein
MTHMHTKQAHPAAAALASGRPVAQAQAPATASAKTACILLTLRIAAVACFSAGSISAYFVASQYLGMLSSITRMHFETDTLVANYAVWGPNSYVVYFGRILLHTCILTLTPCLILMLANGCIPTWSIADKLDVKNRSMCAGLYK